MKQNFWDHFTGNEDFGDAILREYATSWNAYYTAENKVCVAHGSKKPYLDEVLVLTQ
jgi:hypothetical protein